jgi:hypothetical protein
VKERQHIPALQLTANNHIAIRINAEKPTSRYRDRCTGKHSYNAVTPPAGGGGNGGEGSVYLDGRKVADIITGYIGHGCRQSRLSPYRSFAIFGPPPHAPAGALLDRRVNVLGAGDPFLDHARGPSTKICRCS